MTEHIRGLLPADPSAATTPEKGGEGNMNQEQKSQQQDIFVVPRLYSPDPPRLRNYHSLAVFVATFVGLAGAWAHKGLLWGVAYFGVALILGVVVTELIRRGRFHRRRARAFRAALSNTAYCAPHSERPEENDEVSRFGRS